MFSERISRVQSASLSNKVVTAFFYCFSVQFTDNHTAMQAVGSSLIIIVYWCCSLITLQVSIVLCRSHNSSICKLKSNIVLGRSYHRVIATFQLILELSVLKAKFVVTGDFPAI